MMNKSDIILSCEQLTLRILTPQDVSSNYLKWLLDKEINRFLELRMNPPSQIEELSASVDLLYSDPITFMFGIFRNADKTHIGNIKLGPINHFHKFAEVGFLIGSKEDWGKGFASKAIKLVVRFAFEKLSLAKITAGCYADNKGSVKALLKSGFVLEGIESLKYQIDDVRTDGLRYGIINPLFVAGSQ